MDFKPEFIASMQELSGSESAGLLAALDTPSPVSIRFNPYKISEKPEGEQVPWCRYGYYLDERPQFTLDPAFHGGAYYVQEAGSMFIEHIMREAFGERGCEGLRVLDLCAAPGGKTTLLSTLVGLEGVVVANETVRQRTAALVDNAVKWGLGNILVTHNDPEVFAGFKDVFDAVLVDAPCSGEGMMRKNPQAREEWSPGNVQLCAARQRRIVAQAWAALKPGGVLIYSTCTFNRAENEENVSWMMREFDCEGVFVDTAPGWGVVTGEVNEGDTATRVYRFFPHKARAEGFFAAALRKPDGKVREKMPKPRGIMIADADRASAKSLAGWVEQPEFMSFARIGDNFYGYYTAAYPFMRALAERLSVIHSGVVMGQLFHGKLRPDHSLALFTGLSGDAVPHADLSGEQILAYLRKQDIDAAALTEGLNLACHEGLPVGWIKRIGLRTNNLYPKELRILM